MNRTGRWMFSLVLLGGAVGPLAAASADDGVTPSVPSVGVTADKTPPNQDRLLSDVDRAEALAGSSLGGVSIDLPTNVVNVYLVPSADEASLRATIDAV